MDEFLATLGAQAMKYAIRSGIGLTSSYAISQCSRLLKTAPARDHDVTAQLRTLEKLLDSKIKVVSPAIDLVEFKAGRGNVFLDSALPLASSLHREITSLGQRIEAIVAKWEVEGSENTSPRSAQKGREDIVKVVTDIKALLDRIDREIPLLQLAISASGESLSSSLPASVSPSRLLQASTLLTVGDTQFARDPAYPVQIGPMFKLSLYLLFLGHSSPVAQNAQSTDLSLHNGSPRKPSTPHARPTDSWQSQGKKPIWQEVIHKANVRLCRAPQNATSIEESAVRPGAQIEYEYYLEIIEDLDDGRVHADADQEPGELQGSHLQERIPLYQLSKIFYTDSGKILNIGSNSESGRKPILLLKRDMSANHPRSKEEMVRSHLPTGAGHVPIEASEIDFAEEQAALDQQLLSEEAQGQEPRTVTESYSFQHRRWGFPDYLDPAWIAMEMFEEPCESDDDEPEDEDDVEEVKQLPSNGLLNQPCNQNHHTRGGSDASVVSANSELETQIHNLSLRSPLPSDQYIREKQTSMGQILPAATGSSGSFMSRSPFGAIITSLSLIEMLIRLASLQEFQQASHLSIPDHVMSFFLEETSSTGLSGEAGWKMRKEARERVGFDPYSDIPSDD
ncbi:unnamed protein product [Clonostachys chloroleuca]|uniref:Ran-specific GTPase-activating protein 30 n=1 Tax=Clonostachys chloroleuca TaxID=1926264 RepID=A0AA35MJ07_9HYPO|nr:unnamed protein product [Clonostachys chloroleuca]